MSLRDMVLPMATDNRLQRLAEDGGLRWEFEAGYAPLYLKPNREQPERVRLVLMLAEPGRPNRNESFSTTSNEWFRQSVFSPPQCRPIRTEHQNRCFQRRIERPLGAGSGIEPHSRLNHRRVGRC